jgi:leucyl/phenylalanyl-tRNA--protein transferase
VSLEEEQPTSALVARLVRAFPFPAPEDADEHGLLAWGGDLEPGRLIAAYAQGIFPWYDEAPILWFSPDPRMVLRPEALRVGRSLAKRVRAGVYRITMDTAFRAVIRGCRETPRPGQSGTWITPEMLDAYCALHALGFAHSVEAWAPGSDSGEADAGGPGERLVGGLYGVSLGRAFFGESMFAHAPDASKVAFATFVQQLARWGFDFVDCQMSTEHLARFGASEWPRADFLAALGRALAGETRRGPWHFDSSASSP